MKKYSVLYIEFLKQFIKSLIEYKADFILGLIGFFFVQFSGIVFIYLIFQNIPSINGWSFYELLFVYGYFQIPRGIDHIFSDQLWIFSSSTIVEGSFDRYLLRPLNPLFQVVSERFQPDGFGEIVIGTLLLIISTSKLHFTFNALTVPAFLFTVICATIIYFSIKLTTAALAFWIKDSSAYMSMVYTISDFSKYPINIYPSAIKFVLSVIIPFAFTGYFPAAYLLNKTDFPHGVIFTAVASVFAILISYLIWNRGIYKYESTGN